MSSRDYMTRYFQQLGKVLARLIGLREKGEYQQAMNEMDEYLSELFHFSKEELDILTDEELVDKVNLEFNPDTDASRAIAELFYQKAFVYKEMNNTDAVKSAASKSLALFNEIDQKSGCFSIELQERISNLRGLLNETTN